ncbi:hypothetical protein SH2C18_25310 [Clostridium sediminicola]|uniref:hypothetical protein n=1 Tax=Clostridium sediminicola TaxID=3114879 RepID=UPI0031F1D3D0
MISLYKTFSYENTCISIIDEEVDNFFCNCLNEAYTYTMFLVDNTSAYNKDDFKDNVISRIDIQILIMNVFERISEQLLDDFSYDQSLIEKNIHSIDISIKQSKFDENITKICSNLSDGVITKSFNSIGHEVFEIELSRTANKKILLDEQQELIYKKIKDALLSYKLEFKNVLKNITIQLPSSMNTENSSKYII